MFPTKHLIRKDITYLYIFYNYKKERNIDKMKSFSRVLFFCTKKGDKHCLSPCLIAL